MPENNKKPLIQFIGPPISKADKDKYSTEMTAQKPSDQPLVQLIDDETGDTLTEIQSKVSAILFGGTLFEEKHSNQVRLDTNHLCKILGINRSAPHQQQKEQFKQALLKYNPDKLTREGVKPTEAHELAIRLTQLGKELGFLK